jgi:histone H3/H4
LRRLTECRNASAIHRGRVTIMQKDVGFVRDLFKELDPSNPIGWRGLEKGKG